jgi:hypothetical protein
LSSCSKNLRFKRHWGSVTFNNGTPISLKLNYGSKKNLLSSDNKVKINGVYFEKNGELFSSIYDKSPKIKRFEDYLLVEGRLNKKEGDKSVPIEYRIKWTISKLGFLKMNIKLLLKGKIEGKIYYKFPFNSQWLNRYYYSGFRPHSVRRNTSFKHTPMDEIKETGEIENFNSYILSRFIGVSKSELESITFVPGQGYLEELTMINKGNYGIMQYTTQTVDDSIVSASFYILPSPVLKYNSLKRVYRAQEFDIEEFGMENFIDSLVKEGFKYLIYHTTWQLRKPPCKTPEGDSDVLFGSHKPKDENMIKSLLNYAHIKGIKVLFYVGLLNEDNMTDWYRNNNGDQYKTEYHVRHNRELMCLNTPFYEHLLNDTRFILDTLGADGVYVDWYTYLACHEPHPSHQNIPTSNINKLIEYTEFVHSKDKLIFVHSGEEGRIPFLENINDLYIVGERDWSKLNYQTTESGVFDRLINSTGKIAIISDVPLRELGRDSERILRLEVNSSLAEGLNPFGYVFRTQTYELLSFSREEIKTSYINNLLIELRDYEIEDMKFIPATVEDRIAHSNNQNIKVSVLYDEEKFILFVINSDTSQSNSGRVVIDLKRAGFKCNQNYSLKVRRKVETYPGNELIKEGVHVELDPNSTEIIIVQPKSI